MLDKTFASIITNGSELPLDPISELLLAAFQELNGKVALDASTPKKAYKVNIDNKDGLQLPFDSVQLCFVPSRTSDPREAQYYLLGNRIGKGGEGNVYDLYPAKVEETSGVISRIRAFSCSNHEAPFVIKIVKPFRDQPAFLTPDAIEAYEERMPGGSKIIELANSGGLPNQHAILMPKYLGGDLLHHLQPTDMTPFRSFLDMTLGCTNELLSCNYFRRKFFLDSTSGTPVVKSEKMSSPIILRDIKLENFMLDPNKGRFPTDTVDKRDRNNVVLIDLDMVAKDEDMDSSPDDNPNMWWKPKAILADQFCGTPRYAAPETNPANTYDIDGHYYSTTSDVFAFGCVLLELLKVVDTKSSDGPRNYNFEGFEDNIRDHYPDFPSTENFTDGSIRNVNPLGIFKKFLQLMVKPEWELRPSWDQVLAFFQTLFCFYKVQNAPIDENLTAELKTEYSKKYLAKMILLSWIDDFASLNERVDFYNLDEIDAKLQDNIINYYNVLKNKNHPPEGFIELLKKSLPLSTVMNRGVYEAKVLPLGEPSHVPTLKQVQTFQACQAAANAYRSFVREKILLSIEACDNFFNQQIYDLSSEEKQKLNLAKARAVIFVLKLQSPKVDNLHAKPLNLFIEQIINASSKAELDDLLDEFGTHDEDFRNLRTLQIAVNAYHKVLSETGRRSEVCENFFNGKFKSFQERDTLKGDAPVAAGVLEIAQKIIFLCRHSGLPADELLRNFELIINSGDSLYESEFPKYTDNKKYNLETIETIQMLFAEAHENIDDLRRRMTQGANDSDDKQDFLKLQKLYERLSHDLDSKVILPFEPQFCNAIRELKRIGILDKKTYNLLVDSPKLVHAIVALKKALGEQGVITQEHWKALLKLQQRNLLDRQIVMRLADPDFLHKINGKNNEINFHLICLTNMNKTACNTLLNILTSVDRILWKKFFKFLRSFARMVPAKEVTGSDVVPADANAQLTSAQIRQILIEKLNEEVGECEELKSALGSSKVTRFELNSNFFATLRAKPNANPEMLQAAEEILTEEFKEFSKFSNSENSALCVHV